MLLLLIPLPCAAQDSTRVNLWTRFNGALDWVEARATFDTTYIERANRGWTVKVSGNGSLHSYILHNWGGEDMRANLRTSLRATLGFHASYRGIGLGFAINPGKLSGRNADAQFRLAYMGNAYGFEALYAKTKSFRGVMTIDDAHRSNLHVGQIGHTMLAVNAYYSFNRRRFSSAAAFSQSQIQRRSCGSFLIGASYTYTALDLDYDQNGAFNSTLRSHQLGVGAGYAYNFVLPRRWMLHLSCIPQIMAYNSSKLSLDTSEAITTHMRFPDFAAWVRTSLVKNWRRSFISVQAALVSNFVYNGRAQSSSYYNRFNGKINYGIRF